MITKQNLNESHPALAAEWHPTKNGNISPTQLTYGSNKKVWWLCPSCSHEWQAAPNTRSKGHGCPKCGRKKAAQSKSQNAAGFGNSIADKNPSLAREWDYSKNPPNRNPQNVSPWSDQEYYWICSECHTSYLSSVTNRTFGQACPVCAKDKRRISRRNTEVGLRGSLLELMPGLAAEWNYEKNAQEHQLDPTHPIKPNEVTPGSSANVWWLCSSCTNEWRAVVYSRKTNGCPICSNKQILVGYNDLATTHPNLAAEWHSTLNNGLGPDRVTFGSDKKVWWRCSYGHEWEASISSRAHGNGCPKCSAELKTSFPEQTIYYYFQQITTAVNRYRYDKRTEIDVYLPEFLFGIEYDGYFHQTEAAKERDARKDSKLKAAGIDLIRVVEVDIKDKYNDSPSIIYCTPSSNQTYLNEVVKKLLDRLNSITEQSFRLDIDVSRDRSAIFAQYICTKKENSLSIKYTHLADQWHPTKNGRFTPEAVTPGSHKKVWWRCPHGHEWEAIIKSRVKGNGCPFCSGRIPIIGKTDLAATHTHLAQEWHHTKNGALTPHDVKAGSNKKVWWICPYGHEWEAAICDRSSGTGCPFCAGKRR